jgi:hypothetical protein
MFHCQAGNRAARGLPERVSQSGVKALYAWDYSSFSAAVASDAAQGSLYIS